MDTQVLITGGAGFIGSHLAAELIAHGYRVRVADALAPRSTARRRAAPVPPPRRRTAPRRRHRPGRGRRGPRRRRRRLPPRGHGRRRAEHVPDRALHARQRRRHRRLARGAGAAAGAAPGRRVEHEHLRRGTLPRRRGRLHTQVARPLERLRAGGVGTGLRGGRGARERRHRRVHAGQPDLRLRPLEVRPGAAVPHDRARLRHPHRRAPLLQRVRSAPGALQPLHGRPRDLRGAAPERQPPADLRGRTTAPRLRLGARRRPRLPRRARERRRRRRRVQRRQRRRDHDPRGRHAPGTRPRQGHRPRGHRRAPRRRHPPLHADIDRARATLGFRPQVGFDAGLEELAGWLADQAAVDGVEGARGELVARGLAR
jgi:hypothetical protein